MRSVSAHFLPIHTVFGRGYAHTYYICAQMQMGGRLSYMTTYDLHMTIYMTVRIHLYANTYRSTQGCMYVPVWLQVCACRCIFTWITPGDAHTVCMHMHRCPHPPSALHVTMCITRRMVVRTRHIYPSTPTPKHMRLESILIFSSFFVAFFIRSSIEEWVEFNGLELFYCFTPETVKWTCPIHFFLLCLLLSIITS